MPIFLDGKEYNDYAHLEAAFSPMLKDMGVNVPPVPPKEEGVKKPPAGDEKMIQTPNDVYTNQQLEKQDDAVMGGTEISFKQPLESPTEPAGALNTPAGTLVATPEQKLQGAFLQRLTGTESPRPITDILIQFAKEKATHLLDALKAPGDAWAGKLDPMSQQGIERANTLAGLMVMGPAPVAGKLADGTLGSFAGVKAKNAPIEDLKLAQKIEEVGGDPDLIWQKTGWFRGADNRWKFEIPDQEAKIKPQAFEMTQYSKENQGKESLDKAWFQIPNNGKEARPTWLSDILDHPELYKAYPWLKDIPVVPVNGWQQIEGVKGWFDGTQLALAPGNLSDLKSVALHEIQHGIQKHEGFSYGASEEALTRDRWKGLNKDFLDYRSQVERAVSTKLRDENIIPDIWEFKKAIKNEATLPKEGEKYSDWTSTWTKDENEKAIKLLKLSKELGIYDELKKVVKGEDIKKNYEDLLFKEYERVKGEVEARNVQTRMNLGWMDRFQRSPQSTEDITRDQQRWSPWDRSSLKDLSTSKDKNDTKP